MEKIDLIKFLDEIFTPLGFKKKGSNWVLNSDQLGKIVNLQQSNYGNNYYLNYGYVIKNLELTTKLHVENRLASTDKEQQKMITDLLNLDIQINDIDRLSALKNLITNKIVAGMNAINTEQELLTSLMNRTHLNDIPLIVKKYFNIE